MLSEKIRQCEGRIMTYGITPPKADQTSEKLRGIAHKQIERISELEIDALILYDIQDEKERINAERPFPYMKTLDPADYSREYLEELTMPHVIYRCVGKYTPQMISDWIKNGNGKEVYTVFVGAASRNQSVNVSLPQAYEIAQKADKHFMLGGVAIPERHTINRDEHLRVINKIRQGCRFFVSQAVYNVEASKNFLSDYYYYSLNNEITMAPIVLTLTPCGSLKTLQFMKWLGVSIPQWLENELLHCSDILDKSIALSKLAFEELKDYGEEKGIPIGCNIESVSVNKVEVEASIELAKEIRKMF